MILIVFDFSFVFSMLKTNIKKPFSLIFFIVILFFGNQTQPNCEKEWILAINLRNLILLYNYFGIKIIRIVKCEWNFLIYKYNIIKIIIYTKYKEAKMSVLVL